MSIQIIGFPVRTILSGNNVPFYNISLFYPSSDHSFRVKLSLLSHAGAFDIAFQIIQMLALDGMPLEQFNPYFY